MDYTSLTRERNLLRTLRKESLLEVNRVLAEAPLYKLDKVDIIDTIKSSFHRFPKLALELVAV